jgi:hypothetical protein
VQEWAFIINGTRSSESREKKEEEDNCKSKNPGDRAGIDAVIAKLSYLNAKHVPE